jgi:hypothetical protein
VATSAVLPSTLFVQKYHNGAMGGGISSSVWLKVLRFHGRDVVEENMSTVWPRTEQGWTYPDIVLRVMTTPPLGMEAMKELTEGARRVLMELPVQVTAGVKYSTWNY